MEFRVIEESLRNRITRKEGKRIYEDKSQDIADTPEESIKIGYLLEKEEGTHDEQIYLGRVLRKLYNRNYWILCRCGTGAVFTIVERSNADGPGEKYHLRRLLGDHRPKHAPDCPNSEGLNPTAKHSDSPSSRIRRNPGARQKQTAPSGKALGLGIGSGSKSSGGGGSRKLELSLSSFLTDWIIPAARFEHAGFAHCRRLCNQNLAAIFIGARRRDSAELDNAITTHNHDAVLDDVAASDNLLVAHLTLIQQHYLKSGAQNILWPIPVLKDLYESDQAAETFADVSAVATSAAPENLRKAVTSIPMDDRPRPHASKRKRGSVESVDDEENRFRYVLAFATSWHQRDDYFDVQGVHGSCSFRGQISGRSLSSTPLNKFRCPPESSILEVARQAHYLILWQIDMGDNSRLSEGAHTVTSTRASAAALPVFSPVAPLPVDSIIEKAVIWHLITWGLPEVMERTGAPLALRKPASEIEVTEEVRIIPDIIIEMDKRCVAIIEVMGRFDASYLKQKERPHRQMQKVAPLFKFDGTTYYSSRKAWKQETARLRRWIRSTIKRT